MSEDVTFDLELDDGRVAHCWEAASQPYQNCVISAGLVEGAEPDTLYLRFARDGEPSTFLLRPDEMMAVLYVGAGALWSAEMRFDVVYLDLDMADVPVTDQVDEGSKDSSDPAGSARSEGVAT